MAQHDLTRNINKTTLHRSSHFPPIIAATVWTIYSAVAIAVFFKVWYDEYKPGAASDGTPVGSGNLCRSYGTISSRGRVESFGSPADVTGT
jgi:hypothetical protein